MSETVHIPQLRFPEFSGDWNRVKIQKLLDDKSIISHLDGNHGALYPRSEEFTKEGVPYVTANDFINGKVDLKKCKCLPVERASQFKKGIAHNGDVLFAHNATVGPVALLETDLEYVVLSTTATYYRCDNNTLINKYLKVYLTSNDFVRQYSRVMSQSTRNQVPITTQRLFYINLPDKPEQQKIAAFLTAVDSKIEQLSKKQELLGEYKKGAMQQIFSQATRFKADDGNEFPDWEEKKLGDVGKVYQPKTISQTDLTTKGFDVYGANGIIGKYSEYNHEFEQIAVTCRGNTCGTVNFTKPKSWITGNAMVVNVDDSKVVNKTFIYYQLSHTNLTYLITGSGQPQITGDIKTHKVKTPSLPEQTKIANFLSSIDSKIEQVGKQLDESKQFKKALLQQMFV